MTSGNVRIQLFYQQNEKIPAIYLEMCYNNHQQAEGTYLTVFMDTKCLQMILIWVCDSPPTLSALWLQ